MIKVKLFQTWRALLKLSPCIGFASSATPFQFEAETGMFFYISDKYFIHFRKTTLKFREKAARNLYSFFLHKIETGKGVFDLIQISV